jgi:hypothetical protein
LRAKKASLLRVLSDDVAKCVLRIEAKKLTSASRLGFNTCSMFSPTGPKYRCVPASLRGALERAALVGFVKLREPLALGFIVPQYGETVAYVIRILHKQRMNLTFKYRQHKFGAREKCK